MRTKSKKPATKRPAPTVVELPPVNWAMAYKMTQRRASNLLDQYARIMHPHDIGVLKSVVSQDQTPQASVLIVERIERTIRERLGKTASPALSAN
jgi:hypothetical protein